MVLMFFLCVTVSIAEDTRTAEDYKELVFGIIPTDSLDTLKKGFEPFIDDLSKKMGMKIVPRYATDYAGIIEGMRFQKVDFAWFGNKSAIEATERANAEVFAQTTDIVGSPGYWSLIIVHKDSPYNSIEEIIEHGSELRFGNGDPNSTSGFLVPTYYIWAKRGIDPNKHFKIVRNANHEANNMAVAQKQVDFATNNTESQTQFQKNHPQLAQNIKVVWQSPLIPKDPLCWRKDLPDEIKTRLKALFLAYGRLGPDAENERKILSRVSSGWGPFKNSDNRQLIPIRQIDLVKDKMKIENNKDISLADKQERLQKINTQLEELNNYYVLVQKF
ncbi:MAG: phosphonate ABC transporter substrate-binding protein [Deltaproteobacteria bacterium]|nr:phosphonate ABC transporter substrate-binding protein [Deltaproteobacteria bacterium]